MMENPIPRPDTINALRFGVDAAMAMLAGMQLEVFTPLQNGPKTVEQIANAIGVAPTRLRLLLYALVAAGLLTEQDGQFSNTPEAQHFLVKDTPLYIGNMHGRLANQWSNVLKTAESMRTGIPQAYVDFSGGSQEELEDFLRRINVQTVALVGCTIEMPILTGSDNEKRVAHHLHQVEGEAYLAGRYVSAWPQQPRVFVD